jgi:hypothetical protein
MDNPLLPANREAKRLAGLLRRQKASGKIRVPFVEPLVFRRRRTSTARSIRARAMASTCGTSSRKALARDVRASSRR